MNIRRGPKLLFFREQGESKELFFYPVCCDIPSDQTDEDALMANIERNPTQTSGYLNQKKLLVIDN